MTAFNYSSQQWETGPEARETLKKNLAFELSVLNGPKGDSYARFINVDKTLAIKRLREQLDSL